LHPQFRPHGFGQLLWIIIRAYQQIGAAKRYLQTCKMVNNIAGSWSSVFGEFPEFSVFCGAPTWMRFPSRVLW